MVGNEDTEESRLRSLAGREAQGRVAQHRHGMLVLQAPAGKLADDAVRRLAGPAREAIKIERIGGEGGGTPQRADQAPGVASIRRLVLPRGDQGPALRIGQRRVIDVLTDVVLVHSHRAVGCESEILRIGQVQLLRLRRGVRQADVPEPDGRIGREHERNVVVDTLPRAVPRQPAVCSRGPKSRRAGRTRAEVSSRALPASRRRKRLAGPHSTSLPTNRVSVVWPQSKRRTAPLSVSSALRPDRLVTIFEALLTVAIVAGYRLQAHSLHGCDKWGVGAASDGAHRVPPAYT